MERKMKIGVLLSFLLLVTLTVFVSALFLKKKLLNEYPFFPEQDLRISGTSWSVGYIQPIYLWNYSRGSAYFLKTLYSDKSGKLHFLDIFVGGELGANTIKLTQYRRKDGKIVKDKVGGEYNYPFKLGQRIRIEYLVNVDDYESYIESELCLELVDLCQIVNFVNKNRKYSSFPDSQRLDEGIFLPAVQIHEELLSQ